MSSQSGFTATTAFTQLLAANPRRVGLAVKSKLSNTDTVFIQMIGALTATTANTWPLEPGEAFMLGNLWAQIGSAEYAATVLVASNSGSQDVRFIEF